MYEDIFFVIINVFLISESSSHGLTNLSDSKSLPEMV